MDALDLWQLLRCPTCRASLEGTAQLSCPAGHRFPVIDGVPVLRSDSQTDGSAQHAHQQAYYDREYGALAAYRIDNWQKAYLARIAPLWEAAGPDRPYLDSGAGGSAYTVIEAARRGIPAVGGDISLEGMRTARRLAESQGLADRCLFVVCAAERLPFADAAFGASASIAVLEHVPDDQQAIAEISRVTRPAGRVFFAVPNAMDRFPPPLRPIYRWHDRRVGHLRHYSAGGLAEQCERAGLSPLRTIYSAHWVKVWQLLMHLVAQKIHLDDDRLWWRMEAADDRAASRESGMHLNLLLERAQAR